MHPEETERWTNAFLQCACDPSIPGVNFKTGPKLKKRLRLIPGLPKNEVSKCSRRVHVQCSRRARVQAHSDGVRALRSTRRPRLLNRSIAPRCARNKRASRSAARESESLSTVSVYMTCARDQDHWGMYNNMDIMLDSWPYCGTITSVECLMMGVPIVTLQVFSSFEFRRISLLRARLSLRASRLLQ